MYSRLFSSAVRPQIRASGILGRRTFSTWYTKSDEWIKVDGNNVALGITDYAQCALGEIVYVDLPSMGSTFGSGDALVSVESVKAVGEVHSPVGIQVTELNDVLSGEPTKVNDDAEGEGWMVKGTLSDPFDSSRLMDHAAYQSHVNEKKAN